MKLWAVRFEEFSENSRYHSNSVRNWTTITRVTSPAKSRPPQATPQFITKTLRHRSFLGGRQTRRKICFTGNVQYDTSFNFCRLQGEENSI